MAAHTKHGYKGHHTHGADKGTTHHRLMAQHTGSALPAAPTAPMAAPPPMAPPMAGGAPGMAPPGGGADAAEAQTEDEGAS